MLQSAIFKICIPDFFFYVENVVQLFLFVCFLLFYIQALKDEFQHKNHENIMIFSYTNIYPC